MLQYWTLKRYSAIKQQLSEEMKSFFKRQEKTWTSKIQL
jgi:hypothetical protein